jgi:hypothetical protein
MVAHDPKLTDGHKQEKIFHRQGHFDPRTTIDPGPRPPTPKNIFATMQGPAGPPERLPHPMAHGFGGKGAEPKVTQAQQMADMHKRHAVTAAGTKKNPFY